MDSQEISNNIKKRSKELNRILTELKMKTETKSKFIAEKIDKENSVEKMYEEIISELKNKIFDIERENRELRKILTEIERKNHNIEEYSRKENERAFYLLNDLKKENYELKEKLRNNTKIIEVDLENQIKYEVLVKNYNNLFNEYKCYKESNKNNSIEENVNNDLINENNLLKEKINELSKNYEELKNKNDELSNQNLEMEIITKDFKGKIDVYEENIQKLKDENNNYQQELVIFSKENTYYKNENKILKNEIIDLKGNIRVFCRIRPNLDNSNGKYSMLFNNNSLQIEKSRFDFDRVFDPSENQLSIFNEILFLIQSVLEGYNVCIFAYGQTGSGKTHTMEGNKNNAGVIPRAIDEIFSQSIKLENEGWKITFIANYIEIYNETINDLLSEEETKCDIKQENDKIYVKNCTYIKIKSKEEAMELLKIASKNRSIGATKCNNRSSRSHSVFMINIEMKNDNERRNSTLTLIDLAGSERLNESGAEGIRLKETQNINKSLSALGNVMGALIKNENHIPYRNSKLTFLLQNYLSGKSRVLMFVNISPELKHINETLCSLRFAQKVSECKLGCASKNTLKNI